MRTSGPPAARTPSEKGRSPPTGPSAIFHPRRARGPATAAVSTVAERPPLRSAPGPRSLRCMGDAAAFFDLDRTLLRGASGPVISEALRAVGVLSDRTIPGEGLLYKVFDTIGETL